jgi:hypothetical protein
MITVLLIVHGLLAVFLLGAITHQAMSVVKRTPGAGRRSFVDKFGSVNAASYATPIIVLFVVTAIGGAFLYPQYRIDVRPTLEDLQMRAANGVFEIKEHLAAIGLGMLPVYAVAWKTPLAAEQATTRKYLTLILAFLVWWSFLIGHVLNNIKGLVP